MIAKTQNGECCAILVLKSQQFRHTTVAADNCPTLPEQA